MLMLVIASLMRGSMGQNWTVKEDKARNQKSIVVVMDSIGSADNSKVNRLIINSTYDDSIFIQTFLKKGANVTVIQDGKSVVEVEKTVPASKKLAMLEQSAKKIMSQQSCNVTQSSSEARKLLEAIRTMQQSSTDKSVLGRLSKIAAALISHCENIQTSDDDKKLREMVNALESSLNVTQANNKPPDNLENLDKISEMTRALAIRTGDVGLRNYALKIVQAFEIAMEPFRTKPDLSEKLDQLVTSIREDYFVVENATVLNGYLDQLNELQTNLRTPENLTLSLKREIVNLTEAINTIDTVEDVLEADPEQFEKLFANKTTGLLMAQLRKISKSTRNKIMQIEADEILSELEIRIEFFSESQKKSSNFMQVLDAINRTLVNYNGLAGRDGLHMIRDKINSVLRSNPNRSVTAKAMALLSNVKSLHKKIDDVLKVFAVIEKKIRVPKNSKEARALEKAISQIKLIVEKVPDPTVASRAMEIIGGIEKFLNSYKFQNQMKKIEEALSNMNESLAIAETEEEVDKDRKELKKIESSVMRMKKLTPVQQNNVTKMLLKIQGIKRSIPVRPVNTALKHEAREFLRIMNGFMESVMPEIKKKLAKIKKSCDLLSKFNGTDLGGLKDRIQIVSKDHRRILSGLKSIQVGLRKLGLHESNFNATLKFKNFDDTVDRLFELERLLEDPATNDLLKKAFTMVQEVLHANDTLKQLQRMIIFNTKLLNSNDKGQTMTEDTKPAPVPVTRVSLFPLIPDVDDESKVPKVENTATEASDLDNAVENASSKNSSKITAAAQ